MTYVYKNAIQVRDFWAANLGKKSDTNVGQDGILPYFLGTTHDQSRAVQLLDARTLGTSKRLFSGPGWNWAFPPLK